MTDKEVTGNVVNAIIMLVVVIAIIAILALAARSIFPGLYDMFKPGLGQEEKEHVIANFDTLVENMNKCYEIEDENCICEIFPDYPAVFPSGAKAVLGDDLISLYYNNKLLKESEAAIFPDFFITTKKGDKIEIQEMPENRGEQINIIFSEEYPQIDAQLDQRYNRWVISNGFFMDRTGAYWPLTWNPFYKTAEENLNDLVDLAKKIPTCRNGRQEAIKDFEDLTGEIERYRLSVSLDMSQASDIKDFRVKLPDTFLIKFNGNELWLESNNEKIKELSLVSSSNTGDLFEFKEIKYAITPLCSTARKSGEIKNSESIILKKESNAICMQI